MGLVNKLKKSAKLSHKTNYESHPHYQAAVAIEELLEALGYLHGNESKDNGKL